MRNTHNQLGDSAMIYRIRTGGMSDATAQIVEGDIFCFYDVTPLYIAPYLGGMDVVLRELFTVTQSIEGGITIIKVWSIIKVSR